MQAPFHVLKIDQTVNFVEQTSWRVELDLHQNPQGSGMKVRPEAIKCSANSLRAIVCQLLNAV